MRDNEKPPFNLGSAVPIGDVEQRQVEWDVAAFKARSGDWRAVAAIVRRSNGPSDVDMHRLADLLDGNLQRGARGRPKKGEAPADVYQLACRGKRLPLEVLLRGDLNGDARLRGDVPDLQFIADLYCARRGRGAQRKPRLIKAVRQEERALSVIALEREGIPRVAAFERVARVCSTEPEAISMDFYAWQRAKRARRARGSDRKMGIVLSEGSSCGN